MFLYTPLLGVGIHLKAFNTLLMNRDDLLTQTIRRLDQLTLVMYMYIGTSFNLESHTEFLEQEESDQVGHFLRSA